MSARRPITLKRVPGGWALSARLSSKRTLLIEPGPMGWTAARRMRDQWLRQLRPPAPGEVLDRLALLDEQATKLRAREAHILADYVADEHRQADEPDMDNFIARREMRPLWPVKPHPGGTLAERIATATEHMKATGQLPVSEDRRGFMGGPKFAEPGDDDAP